MAGDAVREATFIDVRVGNLVEKQPMILRYVPTKMGRCVDEMMKPKPQTIETRVSTLGKLTIWE